MTSRGGALHAPSKNRQTARVRSCLAALPAEQTRQDSWRSIEVIANRHNRRVESYLQRRRHRPWRNRGS
ncbi:hypothetical protein BST31_11105 [Mycobacterium marseillense]|uniref:Uncharacterized protein n=1 Tax=Mycobacterium marseillense TaxID=701042 RepID=A0AAC9YP04_9MYCO|nr:hypothetical protein CKJ54_04520 [Mycobacterium marseillense]ORA93652.1 hypothetical protein BST31_11105 [Mycobacterium marseillense]